MRYTGKLYRPPSEAHSYILQATIGCSWNNCTYCDMYRDKPVFRVRPLSESLEDIKMAGMEFGPRVEKLFVADGDALILPMDHWEAILDRAAERFESQALALKRSSVVQIVGRHLTDRSERRQRFVVAT